MRVQAPAHFLVQLDEQNGHRCQMHAAHTEKAAVHACWVLSHAMSVKI